MVLQNKVYFGNWDGEICQGVSFRENAPLIMAGPCLLESKELGLRVGRFLKNKCRQLNLHYVFKSSYDKANRTSATSQRGPRIEKGLQWLKEIKEELQVPILVDVHSPEQAIQAAQVADIIQIPAFLCQQRELLAAAASTGKVVQIKKGQWATSEEMLEVAHFIVHDCQNPKVILVERGTNFGYNNLVVDFRNCVDMKKQGHAVVFDATHSVQLPGAGQGKSSGLKEMVPYLTKAACALGVDGVFMEVHENPSMALSDADTQISFETANEILNNIRKAYDPMASNLLHEINNPLMIILNSAQFVKSEIENLNFNKQELLPFLEKIEETVQKLSTIIKS